jgi:hypothetical protein
MSSPVSEAGVAELRLGTANAAGPCPLLTLLLLVVVLLLRVIADLRATR